MPPTNPEHHELAGDLPDTQTIPGFSENPNGFLNEPSTDFSLEETHHMLTNALAKIKPLLGQTYSYPIAADIVCEGPELVSMNPSVPEQEIARFPTLAADQLNDIIQSAQSRFPYWKAVDPHTRAAVLFRTAELMRQRRAELAAWEIFETGKPWREADAMSRKPLIFWNGTGGTCKNWENHSHSAMSPGK